MPRCSHSRGGAAPSCLHRLIGDAHGVVRARTPLFWAPQTWRQGRLANRRRSSGLGRAYPPRGWFREHCMGPHHPDMSLWAPLDLRFRPCAKCHGKAWLAHEQLLPASPVRGGVLRDAPSPARKLGGLQLHLASLMCSCRRTVGGCLATVPLGTVVLMSARAGATATGAARDTGIRRGNCHILSPLKHLPSTEAPQIPGVKGPGEHLVLTGGQSPGLDLMGTPCMHSPSGP